MTESNTHHPTKTKDEADEEDRFSSRLVLFEPDEIAEDGQDSSVYTE